MNPGVYSEVEYNKDLAEYKEAVTKNQYEKARLLRNDMAYGIMGDIDDMYRDFHGNLFNGQAFAAIATDAIGVGFSTASTIATRTAAKTIFSALGGGFTTIGLSYQKNYFAQQAFPIIALAMQTRRDKVRLKIIDNLRDLEVTGYPLNAVKRDLEAYLAAGTLPAGLQELQEEAGVQSASTTVSTVAVKPDAPSNLSAQPGNGQIYLAWNSAVRAASYNLYYGLNPGVTIANGTKVTGITKDSTIQTGLDNGRKYYFIVTSVNSGGESLPSNEVSETPTGAPVANGLPTTAPPTPSQPIVKKSATGVSLIWSRVEGADTYTVYFGISPTVTKESTKITEIKEQTTSITGLKKDTLYFFALSASNSKGESGLSTAVSSMPGLDSQVPAALRPTAH